MRASARVHMRACVRAYVRACICARVCLCARARVRVCVRAWAYVCAHVCVQKLEIADRSTLVASLVSALHAEPQQASAPLCGP